MHRFSTRDARFCQCKIPGFRCFFRKKSIDERALSSPRGTSWGGRGGGGGSPRQLPRRHPPNLSAKAGRYHPQTRGAPSRSWRGYDSVPKSIPSTFGHHLFAKGSRTGTPPRGRPPDHRSRGDPAVSRAETDILSTYMRGARTAQRGDTFWTPFRRVTTQETPLRDQKCRLFCRKPCTKLLQF